MAPKSGRNRAALSEQLRREAYRFDFFQAVRLLQSEAAKQSSPQRDRRRYPVGKDYPPQQEAVRFRALPSHGFPAGPIEEIRDADDQTAAGRKAGPPEMLVTFMGLTGPNGVLPRHYTTMLIERLRGGDRHKSDPTLQNFFDLFNHRVISLFYRAWEKYRFAIAYERCEADGNDREDLFTRCLYCLVGLGTDGLRERMEFDDEAFLYYAGGFAHRGRSAVSLQTMLADYFEMPVEVRQFVGTWLYLDRDDQSALPSSRLPEGLNSQLGTSVVVGERVWDVENKFRIRLGPVGYRDFCQFVPSGDALRCLCQLVRSYVGPQFDFDVQPVLRGEEAPWCKLGGDGANGDGARLGWNTWIRSGAFDRDVSDAVFSLEGLPWTKQV
ncbi:MAG: type VI secretion system baseplate subunit TssG [Candidatus Nealsonbacteria bacterium]|nr:type VI secretion system baseplate subunit TssG [Candidatus Nealsonbacteria bacterium]